MKRRNETRKICRNKKREIINSDIKELEIENRKNENRKFLQEIGNINQNL
jgi:hypothetical protein